ncbi:protein of unknown function [Burkholderia multivorans]
MAGGRSPQPLDASPFVGIYFAWKRSCPQSMILSDEAVQGDMQGYRFRPPRAPQHP